MKSSKRTLLWRLSSPAAPADSFLFGTMHVRDRRAFGALDAVYKAIEYCETFAAETDLNQFGATANFSAFQLPEGKTLDQLLPIKKYEKLRRIIRKAMQIDIEKLRYFQPIIIANLIDESLLMKDMPFSLDQHLWRYAEQHGKKTIGIETPAEQMQILLSIPLDYQLKALLSIGRQPAKHRQALLKAAEWYEQARIDQLYRSTKRSLHGLRRLMLYDRNQRMARRIAVMMEAQSTFAAIGAAHLWGEQGVLKLLKNDGFVVKARNEA